jgi:hypothetical protein
VVLAIGFLASIAALILFNDTFGLGFYFGKIKGKKSQIKRTAEKKRHAKITKPVYIP